MIAGFVHAVLNQNGKKIKLLPGVADPSQDPGLREAAKAWLEKATGPPHR